MQSLEYQNGADLRKDRARVLGTLPPRVAFLDRHRFWRPPLDGRTTLVFAWPAAAWHVLASSVLFFVCCVVIPVGIAHAVESLSTLPRIVARVAQIVAWLPAVGIFLPVMVGRIWDVAASYRRGPWLRRSGGQVELQMCGIVAAADDISWPVQYEEFRSDGQLIQRSVVRLAVRKGPTQDVTQFFGRHAQEKAVQLADNLSKFVGR